MQYSDGAASHKSVLETIFESLYGLKRADGLGTIIQITSAETNAGTSFVARSLAEIAAKSASGDQKRVGLFDCDLKKLSQTIHYFAPLRAGRIQGPYDASFGAGGYWQVTNSENQITDMPGLCGVYIDGKTGLAFTSLIWDQLQETDRVELIAAPNYWQNLRTHFSFIFVDCPALDRSRDALILAPQCDMSILVAGSQTAQSPSHKAARDTLVSAGAQFAGMVVNGGAPLYGRSQNQA
jgi:Mrp family chromosome partitioning ATPase